MRFLLAFLFFTPLFSQEDINHEIFLFTLSGDNEEIQISNGKNISQNPGYDNQPSFYSSDTLIYSRTRNGQTDIAGYSPAGSKILWFSNTKKGSEYSPQRIAGTSDLAAVRLDTTGLQLLYKYDKSTGESQVLISDQKVGYFFFYNETTLVTAVLSGSGMDLVINELETGSSQVLIKNIGRSIHKVPESNYISYTIRNDQNDMDLYLMDLEKEEPESFFLCTLPDGVQDYAWLDQNRMLLGKGPEIFMYDMLGKSEWTPVTDLSKSGLSNITRITINKTRDKLALAAEIEEN